MRTEASSRQQKTLLSQSIGGAMRDFGGFVGAKTEPRMNSGIVFMWMTF